MLFHEWKTRFTARIMGIAVFEQISSRYPINMKYQEAFSTVANIHRLHHTITATMPTKAAFMEWADNDKFRHTQEPHGFETVAPLLEIVTRDTFALFKRIYKVLNDISVGILDDSQMEERLHLWRQFIMRCQYEVPQLRKDLSSFHDILYPKSVQDITSTDKVPDQTKAPEISTSLDEVQFENLLSEFEKLEDQISKASDSLISNMNLLVSKRSIQEAKNVTKLTELAFVYIPLTFSATLFGMQIEQFNDRAPLSTFVILALIVTVLSYAFRLIIRSQAISEMHDKALRSIGDYAKAEKKPYRRGMPVPTKLFLEWALVESQKLSIKAFLELIRLFPRFFKAFWATTGFIITSLFMSFLLAVIPVSVVMTRNLDPGIKNGVSAAVIISTTVTITILYWRSSPPEYRMAFPRMIRRAIRFMASGRIGKLFMWMTSILVFSLPLGFVWTRDLAAGIKAGVTAFLLTGSIAALLLYVISRLITKDMLMVRDFQYFEKNAWKIY